MDTSGHAGQSSVSRRDEKAGKWLDAVQSSTKWQSRLRQKGKANVAPRAFGHLHVGTMIVLCFSVPNEATKLIQDVVFSAVSIWEDRHA